VDFGERLVPFETCFNFRDVGGYETIDGRRVRWGSVFRSDTLHRLTTADLERALELGIRTVIDLRSTDELTEWGGFPAPDDVDFHHLPLFEHDEPQLEPFDREDPEPPVGEMYVQMATAGREALASSLRVIAEGEHAVVFHCAAGKDRTGVLAAVVLDAVGVTRDAIVADYARTEERIEAIRARLAELGTYRRMRAVARGRGTMTATADTMSRFLHRLDGDYGGGAGYLRTHGATDDDVRRLRGAVVEESED
jgi:protein-tyrosine phosphatase